VSTPTGRALIDALPAVATTPDMTAVWEAAMRAILECKQPLEVFLDCIETQLRQLVEQAKARGPIAVAHAPRLQRKRTERRLASAPPPRPRRTPSRRTRNGSRSSRPIGR
jgi:DNA topoisomerase III